MTSTASVLQQLRDDLLVSKVSRKNLVLEVKQRAVKMGLLVDVLVHEDVVHIVPRTLKPQEAAAILDSEDVANYYSARARGLWVLMNTVPEEVRDAYWALTDRITEHAKGQTG